MATRDRAIARLNDPLPAGSADDKLWQPDRESLTDDTLPAMERHTTSDPTRDALVNGIESREGTRWRHLETVVVRAAARSVWSKVKLLTFSGMLNHAVVLPVIRLLAVLMCKVLFSAIKERLLKVLSDWLPRTSGAAG